MKRRDFVKSLGVAGDTGVVLNNGHRFGFILDPDHVNSLAGGQVAKGVMCPTIVMKGDAVLMGVGAAGGYTIPQTVGQVIAKVLVYGFDIQRAIASPRLILNRGGGRVPLANDEQTLRRRRLSGGDSRRPTEARTHAVTSRQRRSRARRVHSPRDRRDVRGIGPASRRACPCLVEPGRESRKEGFRLRVGWADGDRAQAAGRQAIMKPVLLRWREHP